MNLQLLRGAAYQLLLIAGTTLVAELTIIISDDRLGQAQVPPPITSSGLNTVVKTNANVHTITGGTRPGGGTNLFHSFGEFNVPGNNIANFLNETALPTTNILGRVTGSNISNIFGTIQTNGPGGFGNANLFLMNPAGFLFGPNATVTVGGMVTFTSADYLRLTDGGRFNASLNPAAPDLLTAAPVAAFGFIGSNPGAITVQGSRLSATEGTGISLVGGDITIQAGALEDETLQPARLSAPGGQLNLVSIASPGEVLAANFLPIPNTVMGRITLSEGSILDVSSDSAGTVRIRGGQLVIDHGTISSDTADTNGASTAIDIRLTGDLTINTGENPALTARTSGSGDAGKIELTSESMEVTAASEELMSVIDTHTTGSGKGGDVSISTGDLIVSGDPFATTTFIDSGVVGTEEGHGGNVTLTATGHIDMQDTLITTGHLQAQQLGEDSLGTAGNVTITADSLHLSLAPISTELFSFTPRGGAGGNITIAANDFISEASFVNASGFHRGGAITLNTSRLIASETEIATGASLGLSGGVVVNGNLVEMTDGSTILSSTGGDVHAAPILITATDHVTFSRPSGGDRPSGVFSNSFGTLGTLGNAGDVVISTPRLELSGGARINTSTRSSGLGGSVTIDAAQSVSISGEIDGLSPEPLFSLGTLQPSGIYTLSIGGRCTGPCGNAGDITVRTGSLNLNSGGQVNSGTSSTGRAGDITVNAGNTISISGTLSNGQPAGILSRTTGNAPASGAGGNINLSAGQGFTISNGAAVSASSTGPGKTGNITINAGNQFTMTNGSVTTQANQASGGTIKITTNPNGTVELTNSTISASVLDGTGGGGSVNIDPQFVILQNSQILAEAVQGDGGNINITITNGGLFLPDSTSRVSASSEFGQQGTVTIQSPNAPAGGKIQPLGKAPLQVTALLSQRCAAIARGEVSSFVVAGRDTLPTEPGGWLPSPLAFGSPEAGAVVQAGDRTPSSESSDPTILSLRRLPSPNKVAQLLGDDWVTGCGS